MSTRNRERRQMERNTRNPEMWSAKFNKAMDKVDKDVKADSHMPWNMFFRQAHTWRKPAPFHNGRKRP